MALFLFANPSPAQLNHIEEAASLLSQGQADQAEAEARQALKNPSTRALALAMMGTIRVQQGQYGASENFLTQALALDPQLVGHGPLWGTLTCWKINPCSVCEMQRRTKSSEMHFNLGKLFFYRGAQHFRAMVLETRRTLAGKENSSPGTRI